MEQYAVCALLLASGYLFNRYVLLRLSGVLKHTALLVGIVTSFSLAGFFRLQKVPLILNGPSSFAGFQPQPDYLQVITSHISPSPKGSHVAVTSGPNIKFDNFHFYHFLGKHFQNQVSYIPISTSGEFLDFFPHENRFQNGSFESWVQRLKDADIDYIVSLYPESIELQWMLENPQYFDPLEVRRHDKYGWGVFKLRQTPE